MIFERTIKLNVCAFTGHRPSKLPWKQNEDAPGCIALKAALEQQISKLVDAGIVGFFSGMAEGTDLICSDIVLRLREKNPAIKLHCALPCVAQADKWTTSSFERYHDILTKADSVIYVSRKAEKNCYLARNRFMVNYSSVLMAVYNGDYRSGTAMTVRYARKMGRELYIINPATTQIVHENVPKETNWSGAL